MLQRVGVLRGDRLWACPGGFGRRIACWFTFADHGERAARHMAVAWGCVACFVLVDLVWMPLSTLSFAPSTWRLLARLALALALSFAICQLVAARFRTDGSWVARALRAAATRAELVWRSVLLVSASAAAGGVFCYLAMIAALPLRDALLAEIDRRLGVDWLACLAFLNGSPDLGRVLTFAYHSTGAVVLVVCLWLCATKRVDRLTEFLAILSATTLGLGIGMVLVPAAGAFVHFAPAREAFSHFSDDAGTFHLALFESLRRGARPVIDFTTADGMVTFPSFHTVLGVITTWALRDRAALLVPALLLNGAMIVSTLPEGGHYVADIIAGAGVAAAAITLVGWRGRASSPA